jgi:glucan phosphorylase
MQQFVDLAHSLIVCNLQALSIEVLEKIKEKNMFTFGSTRQKHLAYQNFLKFKRDEGQLENRPHVSPSLLKVFNFMDKYQEQLPGFKFVVKEIFQQQIFGA